VIQANAQLRKEVTKTVKEAMQGVVNEPSGTAYGSRIQYVHMGGKTGTAQSVGEKGKNLGDHAWFIAFAPVEEPAISISVLVEYGGHGSSVAAPVAKAISENLFKPKVDVKEAKIRENR
jgi:penicillin-binding protein 2